MTDKFYRIKNNDSVLGGVCQGLSQHFGIDPVIIRVVFVVFFFTPVPSFIIYAILWIALPVQYEMAMEPVFENQPQTTAFQTSNFNTMSRRPRQGNVVGGVILIILGSIFAFRTFFDINLFHYIGKMWPLFLVGLGVWLIIKDRMDDGDDFDNFNSPTKTGPSTTTPSETEF